MKKKINLIQFDSIYSNFVHRLKISKRHARLDELESRELQNIHVHRKTFWKGRNRSLIELERIQI